jgi:prepilin-type processing-associated H-X9-DG protein
MMFVLKKIQMKKKILKCFTMIELMVVLGIILTLAAMLLPTLATSKDSARATFCVNNIKNLNLATLMYAQEWERFPAWGCDKTTTNLTRWHGRRDDDNNTAPYDPAGGPLFKYMKGTFVTCPALDKTVDVDHPSVERGGGGYGYNLYVGTCAYSVEDPESEESYQKGIWLKDLKHPDTTVTFTDNAANLNSSGELSSNSASGTIGEYSITVAPFYVNHKTTQTGEGYTEPSIHFRHNKLANFGWTDGHVDGVGMTWTLNSGWRDKNLGFWGTKDDNSLFNPF